MNIEFRQKLLRVFIAVFILIFPQPWGLSVALSDDKKRDILVMVTPEGEDVFTGFLREFYDALSAESGIIFSVREAPKNRALILANSGAVDGLAARIDGLQSKGVPNVRIIKVSHYTVQHVIFAKDPKVIASFSTPQAVIPEAVSKGYVIGYLRGSKKAQQLLSDLPAHLTYVIKNSDNAFTLLSRNRISAFLAGPGIVSRQILRDRFGESGIREVVVLSETPLFPYLHVSRQDLIPKIEQGIQRMHESGKVREILMKYQ